MWDREPEALTLTGGELEGPVYIQMCSRVTRESRAGKIQPAQSAVSLNAQDLCDLLVW